MILCTKILTSNSYGDPDRLFTANEKPVVTSILCEIHQILFSEKLYNVKPFASKL